MANRNQRPASSAQAARRSSSQAGTRTAKPARSSAARPNGTQRPAAQRPSQGRQATAVAPAPGPWTPHWLRLAALGLSVLGVALSIYLTIAHLAGAGVLICSNKGLINCEAVTTSAESKLFGIFPVAELGLAFYVVMALLNLPWIWRPVWNWLPARIPAARLSRWQQQLPVLAWRVRLAGIVVGMLFILYLVYTELITLRNICLWCTYVHITTFLLFALLVAQAAFWGDPSKAAAGATRSEQTS